MNAAVRLFVVALFAASLAACNSGGNKPPAQTQAPTSAPTTTPTGTGNGGTSSGSGTSPAPTPTPTSTGSGGISSGSGTSPAPTPTPTPVPSATYSVSGVVSGGTIAGVTITATPGGTAVVTGKSGTYTLSSLPAGIYTITPSDGVIQFTPTSREVGVSNKDVVGVNFTDPLPVLKTGKIIYPCPNGICQKDLATGIEKTAVDLSATSEQPINLVPFKKSARVVYPSIKTDVNPLLVAPGDGDWITSLLPASTPRKVIWAAVNLTGAYKCMNPEEMFDVINTQGGDIMVTPVFCWASNLNGIITQDIFIVKLNGKEEFIQVTNNKKWEYSPVFAGTDKNGNMRILFAQEKGTSSGGPGTILEQVVNMTNKNKPTLVGSPTVFAKNIIADTNYGRDISVNATYTKVAFVREVSGVNHIFVKSIAGGLNGTETDLGPGENPAWSSNGSNLIMFSANKQLFAVKPDGTGRVGVPIPKNLYHGTGWSIWSVVFAPPGS